MPRVASIWFPQISTDRIERRNGRLRDRPLALVAEAAGRILLQAVNRRAAAAGLAPGMALADARAICPQLVTRPAELHADARLLGSLARWMKRYSPLVAIDSPDGLFLDTTGAAHLFGGEVAMLHALLADLERLAVTARAALADTPGTAWALARHGGLCTLVEPGANRGALAPLPVTALRVEASVAELCRRLGLRAIGDLYPLSRAALASRFGMAAVRRLDQALGDEDEPLRWTRFKPPLSETLQCPEPIGRTAEVEAALARLLERLCARLEADGAGARRMALDIERVDGSRQAVTIATARPCRSPALLLRLFRDRLDGLDAGFGIDQVHLCAERCEPLAAEQTEAEHGDAAPGRGPDATLIDRLVNRFGHERVLRFAPAESHLPDRAYLTFSAAGMPSCPAWSLPAMARPLRMLGRPEPVAACEGDGQMPPAMIRWRGRLLAVAPLAGPERIEPEWWHDDPAWRTGGRDYWWVQAKDGERLWLFRTSDAGHETRGAWFVHGLAG